MADIKNQFDLLLETIPNYITPIYRNNSIIISTVNETGFNINSYLQLSPSSLDVVATLVGEAEGANPLDITWDIVSNSQFATVSSTTGSSATINLIDYQSTNINSITVQATVYYRGVYYVGTLDIPVIKTNDDGFTSVVNYLDNDIVLTSLDKNTWIPIFEDYEPIMGNVRVESRIGLYFDDPLLSTDIQLRYKIERVDALDNDDILATEYSPQKIRRGYQGTTELEIDFSYTTTIPNTTFTKHKYLLTLEIKADWVGATSQVTVKQMYPSPDDTEYFTYMNVQQSIGASGVSYLVEPITGTLQSINIIDDGSTPIYTEYNNILKNLVITAPGPVYLGEGSLYVYANSNTLPTYTALFANVDEFYNKTFNTVELSAPNTVEDWSVNIFEIVENETYVFAGSGSYGLQVITIDPFNNGTITAGSVIQNNGSSPVVYNKNHFTLLQNDTIPICAWVRSESDTGLYISSIDASDPPEIINSILLSDTVGIDNAYLVGLKKLSTTEVLVVWIEKTGTVFDLLGVIVTIDGDGIITIGTKYSPTWIANIDISTFDPYMNVEALDSTKFIVHINGYPIALTVSGGVLTWGAEPTQRYLKYLDYNGTRYVMPGKEKIYTIPLTDYVILEGINEGISTGYAQIRLQRLEWTDTGSNAYFDLIQDELIQYQYYKLYFENLYGYKIPFYTSNFYGTFASTDLHKQPTWIAIKTYTYGDYYALYFVDETDGYQIKEHTLHPLSNSNVQSLDFTSNYMYTPYEGRAFANTYYNLDTRDGSYGEWRYILNPMYGFSTATPIKFITQDDFIASRSPGRVYNITYSYSGGA